MLHRFHTSTAPGVLAFAENEAETQNAIELLSRSHQEINDWFSKYESAKGNAIKHELANKICSALVLHGTIENEIFYPAYLAATGNWKLHHAALVKHLLVKRLIAAIKGSDAGGSDLDAKVKVLSELVQQRIHEDERPDGIFAEARRASMDLVALGAQMEMRKSRLMLTLPRS